MLGERRAAAMDNQKRALATIKAVMRKLFVGEPVGLPLCLSHGQQRVAGRPQSGHARAVWG